MCKKENSFFVTRTAALRLTRTVHARTMTVGESDVNFQQEKERLACEWLAKLKPVLGLDDDVHTKKKNTTASTANQRTTTTKGAEKRSSGAKGKYADISDDDDDDDENAEGAEKENFVKRQREVFYKVWSCMRRGTRLIPRRPCDQKHGHEANE